MRKVQKKKKRFNVGRKSEQVSRYLYEGNPNTDKVIEEMQGEFAPDTEMFRETREFEEGQ